MFRLRWLPLLWALPKSVPSFSSWTWLALAWVLLCTALWGSQTAPTLQQAPLFALMDWQPGLWQTQPWRLWTAALVHWSGAHLLLNLVGCAAVIAWGNAAALGARQTLAWMAAWPLTQVLLAASPSLPHYGGLSGVLHAGVAIGAWTLLWQGPGQRRGVGAVVLLGLGTKLLLEEPMLGKVLGLDVQARALAGAPGLVVATYAHATGTVAGLVCAVAVDLVKALWPRRAWIANR